MFTQRQIDRLSDALKAEAVATLRNHIVTEEAFAYFANMDHGVELRTSTAYKPDGLWQPLFRTPAHPGQEPAAWWGGGSFVTRDRSLYSEPDKGWHPLYTAR